MCASHECAEEHDDECEHVCFAGSFVFGVAVAAFADFGCGEVGFADGAGVGVAVGCADLDAIGVDDFYGGVGCDQHVRFVDVADFMPCCVYCVDCYGEVSRHEE